MALGYKYAINEFITTSEYHGETVEIPLPIMVVAKKKVLPVEEAGRLEPKVFAVYKHYKSYEGGMHDYQFQWVDAK